MTEIHNEQLERLTHNTHSVDVPSRIIRKLAAELLQARQYYQHDKLAMVDAKFVSGNSVEVDRVTITRAEWTS